MKFCGPTTKVTVEYKRSECYFDPGGGILGGCNRVM